MFWFYLLGAILVIGTLVFIIKAVREEVKNPTKYYSGWAYGSKAGTPLPWWNRFGWIAGFAAFGLAIGALVVGLVGMLLNFIFFYAVNEPYETYNSLTTINDGSSVQGSFFLGSGTIESVPVYMYYVQNDRGEFRLYHADASDSYVTYTDGPPMVVYHKERSSNTFWSLGPGDDYTEYEFRVPRGSVKQVYNLDAK